MSIKHMRELKKLPLPQLNPELGVIAQVLADKVYLELKVDSEDVDAANERLNLEANSDYQKMVQEYMTTVQEIKLG